MTTYPDLRDYEALYARYLDRPVTELLDLAGDVSGKVAWDLCCGGGAVSAEMLRRGAKEVVAVDASDKMTSMLQYAVNGRKFRLYVTDVGAYLGTKLVSTPPPHVVVCRQAVNYWMDERSARDLGGCMEKGSVFVFNTFNEMPPEIPTVLTYERDGMHFVESSWLVKHTGMVHHVQVRQGYAPHVTEFRWIPQEEFVRILDPWFVIRVQERGKASFYRCVRK